MNKKEFLHFVVKPFSAVALAIIVGLFVLAVFGAFPF